MNQNFESLRNNVIGTVEFVSPREIKILLDVYAPANTSLNNGTPQLFPKINGFLLIPNETGALIGIITWIGIEYSAYPKRKGYKDFDLVDLPFPLRKLSLSPLGILKEKDNDYEIERGVYAYPSVGDIVIVPSQKQLKAIVQNKIGNSNIKIGISSLAANAPVFVDPDKLFGRHLAILGNTGSGKSCSVAGLIKWSIESAQAEIKKDKKDINKNVNARFIIFDPNGEYEQCFNDLTNVKKYKVKIIEDSNSNQLKVPSWMWNSWEWASISQASSKTQRPLLRRALKEIKNAEKTNEENIDIKFKKFLISLKIRLLSFQNDSVNLSSFPGRQNYGEFLEGIKESLDTFDNLEQNYEIIKNKLISMLEGTLSKFPKNHSGFFPAFSLKNVNSLLGILEEDKCFIRESIQYTGPDEDSPMYFKNDEFFFYIERLALESNQQQYFDFFLMRLRGLFADKRIASVVNTENNAEITLEKWLTDYIGENNKLSINIIDLSLLPSEILSLVVAVISRLIFEAHHRYKINYGCTLPSVLVVDEAHNLIKRYEKDEENISSQGLCVQVFEKIAKEGRKFGLGLVLASQRPSELSQTVLSQCNTFLLHRIVSDRDQEMVKKLVPDAMGGILNELSVLPSRKAILLGWATPIPILVEMNELSESQRPKSKDPEFWDVWINKKDRKIDWQSIANDWQQYNKLNDDKKLE